MDYPNRKLNRLNAYDYGTVGCYFVTLCTYERQRLFKIVGNDLCVVPPLQNQIIQKGLKKTESKFSNIKIDKYIIMPDHIHFIINISERCEGCSLPEMMRYFKAMTTNSFIKGVRDCNLPPFKKRVWQKSYYDHVIRNQNDYKEIWEYIENNPEKWIEMHETRND